LGQNRQGVSSKQKKTRQLELFGKADPYGVNLRLRKSGSKCAVKVFFSKLKMTPYGESENGKYEADVRLFALTIRSIF